MVVRPTADLMEIEFTAGVWTNLGALVDAGVGWEVRRGRATRQDRLQPSTLRVTLTNPPDSSGVAHLTPDNPLSTYYPNWRPGVRIRARTTVNSLTYTLFTGWVEAIDLVADGPETTVVVTATDLLGQLARRRLLSDHAERVVFYADTDTHGVWPFDDGPEVTAFRNVGSGGSPAEVVEHFTGSGSLTVEQPSDLLLDGAVTFSQDTAAVGPVLLLRLADEAVTVVGFWLRVPVGTAPASVADVAVGYNAAGAAVWRVSIVLVNSVLEVRVRDGAGATQWTSSTDGVADGRWRSVAVHTYNDGAERVRVDVDGVEGTEWTGAGRSVRTVTLGGYMDPRVPKKQTSAPCTIGGVFAHHNAADTPITMPFPWAAPRLSLGSARATELYEYLKDVIDLSGGFSSTGDDGRMVRSKLTAGRSLLDVWDELAVSTGSTVRVSAAGVLQYRMAGTARPTTVGLTLDAQGDADGQVALVWRRGSDTNPTRVVVSSPAGSGVAVDAAAEARGERRDESLDTCCATVDDAVSVGTSLIVTGARLSLAQVGLALTTAASDLYAATFGVDVGSRVTVSGLPSGLYGTTQATGYIQGMTLARSVNDFRVVLDLQPADSPPDGVAGSDTYGRADAGTMTVGSVSSSATSLVITTTSGPTLSTSAGEYPLDLDVNGERVTVGSAPAGSSSPQTVTVTRGVSPTVARAHGAGESVQVWWGAATAV